MNPIPPEERRLRRQQREAINRVVRDAIITFLNDRNRPHLEDADPADFREYTREDMNCDTPGILEDPDADGPVYIATGSIILEGELNAADWTARLVISSEPSTYTLIYVVYEFDGNLTLIVPQQVPARQSDPPTSGLSVHAIPVDFQLHVRD
jgi:hypothetical protein